MKYSYRIDQILETAYSDYLFIDYSHAMKLGGIHPDIYCTVDFGVIEADDPEIACELLFERYNSADCPAYPGRTMSVSDIVTLYEPESKAQTRWYCDSIGFKRLEV